MLADADVDGVPACVPLGSWDREGERLGEGDGRCERDVLPVTIWLGDDNFREEDVPLGVRDSLGECTWLLVAERLFDFKVGVAVELSARARLADPVPLAEGESVTNGFDEPELTVNVG